jgi:dienelactone hydrolase
MHRRHTSVAHDRPRNVGHVEGSSRASARILLGVAARVLLAIVVTGVALAVPASTGAAASPAAALLRLFAYHPSLPLSIHVLSTAKRGQITVREVSFSVDRRTRLSGYLVTPAAGDSRPAILFDPGRWQTKDFFLSEAVDDARRGAVTLSVDDLSTGYPSFTVSDRGVLINRVIGLRRAVELLMAQPGVDRTRLAFVGHSDGAELGGILAGVDRRFSDYVLMSGGGIWDRSSSAAYNRAVAPADADNYIGYAAPAALFFQNGLYDQFVPRSDGLRYQRLGSRPKIVRWYPADHMLDAQALRDRQRWLARRLHLTTPRTSR